MSEKQESLVPTGIPTCRDCYAAMPREGQITYMLATMPLCGASVKAKSASEARTKLLKAFKLKNFPFATLKIVRLPEHTHYEDWPK